MNELNKKIESMLEHSLPIMPDNQVWLLTNDLSKLFLEEIKEAFEAGKQFGSIESGRECHQVARYCSAHGY